VIDKIGLLDEEFFMYGEDLDWCWRAKEAGYKVVYYPKTKIIHYLYGSSKAVAFKSVRWAHDAMRIFYRKHYAPKHNWLFNQFIYLGIIFRMYLVIVVNLFRNKKNVH
jgi:GT2 family glycosyltransferase